MTEEPIDEAGALYAAEVSREGRFLSDAVIAHIADIASEHGGNFEGEGDRSVQIGGPSLNGTPSQASGLGAVAVGSGARALSQTSVALGWSTRAGAESGSTFSQIAIGNAATATGDHSVAIGPGASATADHTMVLGPERATGSSPVYTVRVPGRLKLSSRNTEPDDAATIGMLDSVFDRAYPGRSEGGNYSVAWGRGAKAGPNATAIGGLATSESREAVAVGRSANAAGDGSTAVGTDTSARGIGSTALGGSSSAAGASAVAIGGGIATGLAAVAVGANAQATGILSMALGAMAPAASANTAVIGPEMGLNDDMTPTGDPYVVRIPGALELSEHNTLPGHAARRDWVEAYVAESGGGGEPGADGLSAYEVAVENGFEGTESEWLVSLRGADASLPEIAWDGPRLIVDGETSPDLTGPVSTTPGPPGPPGAVPTAADYAIVGPGRPDVPATTGGLVTASTPVGATYTSTDGAGVGAWQWLKTPDGWRVTDGDTGWRSVAALGDPDLWKIGTPNHIVRVRIRPGMLDLNLSLDSNSSERIKRVPIGFTHQQTGELDPISTLGGANRYRLIFSGSDLATVDQPAVSLVRTLRSIPFDFNQWPQTLPGAPG